MESLLRSDSLFDIYKSLFDYNPDACYALNAEGQFQLFNEVAEETTGYMEKEVIQLPFTALIDEKFLPETMALFQRVLRGSREQFDTIIKAKDGSGIELSITAAPIYIDGEVKGIVGTAKDVTERNNLELLLNGQNKVLEMIAQGEPLSAVLDRIITIVETISEGALGSILLTNEEGTHLNAGTTRNLPNEYVRMIDNMPIGPDAASCGTAAYLNCRVISADIDSDPRWALYKEVPLKHGLRACWSSPVRDSQRKVLGVFAIYYTSSRTPTTTDMQIIEKATHLTSLAIQHYRAEEQIKFMAFHDALTGLPNKQLFNERLTEAISRCKATAEETVVLLYMDLDRFKLINDTLGHNVGDALLNQVARRMEACIRKTDTASRQGGDEFAILLEGASKKEATIVADRVLNALARPFEVGGHEIFITPSIGICLYPPDGSCPEELIRKADLAMYQAKKEGKNNFQFYDESLNSRIYDRLQIENELRKAIDSEQFSLRYQPIVDLVSGQLVGAEALTRWDHPELGSIPPDQFIPIAEETGLILPLGERILRMACKELKKWQFADTERFTLAVNLSIRQFYQPNLLKIIQGILRETETDPTRLTIEITESMTMNVKKASSILYQLKSMGINISMDDFGTGYSSLNCLKEFPIDHLKIDQTFIREISGTNGNKNIAATIISMAHTLGMKVIAEGVETEEQLHFLKQHNSDEAQGYLFSKPLAAGEFHLLIDKGFVYS
ncbi:sensor domain-containing protein [Planococcus lenghuensis]|uniref:EAL domain-containing protein n=1 Tax=Planococcus lenghuensis TaxID=2213202 RepID=A0A1Q2L2Z5_9BACL|nr:EAL domain-containing protein [Planococcus lenghuensis]AQQ54835.1 hypothetical protein B0X71_18165 [Planococcus lenghuensis]